MNKILKPLLCIAATLALAACTATEPTADQPTGTPPQLVPLKLTVAHIQIDADGTPSATRSDIAPAVTNDGTTTLPSTYYVEVLADYDGSGSASSDNELRTAIYQSAPAADNNVTLTPANGETALMVPAKGTFGLRLHGTSEHNSEHIAYVCQKSDATATSTIELTPATARLIIKVKGAYGESALLDAATISISSPLLSTKVTDCTTYPYTWTAPQSLADFTAPWMLNNNTGSSFTLLTSLPASTACNTVLPIGNITAGIPLFTLTGASGTPYDGHTYNVVAPTGLSINAANEYTYVIQLTETKAEIISTSIVPFTTETDGKLTGDNVYTEAEVITVGSGDTQPGKNYKTWEEFATAYRSDSNAKKLVGKIVRLTANVTATNKQLESLYAILDGAGFTMTNNISGTDICPIETSYVSIYNLQYIIGSNPNALINYNYGVISGCTQLAGENTYSKSGFASFNYGLIVGCINYAQVGDNTLVGDNTNDDKYSGICKNTNSNFGSAIACINVGAIMHNSSGICLNNGNTNGGAIACLNIGSMSEGGTAARSGICINQSSTKTQGCINIADMLKVGSRGIAYLENNTKPEDTNPDDANPDDVTHCINTGAITSGTDGIGYNSTSNGTQGSILDNDANGNHGASTPSSYTPAQMVTHLNKYIDLWNKTAAKWEYNGDLNTNNGDGTFSFSSFTISGKQYKMTNRFHCPWHFALNPAFTEGTSTEKDRYILIRHE